MVGATVYYCACRAFYVAVDVGGGMLGGMAEAYACALVIVQRTGAWVVALCGAVMVIYRLRYPLAPSLISNATCTAVVVFVTFNFPVSLSVITYLYCLCVAAGCNEESGPAYDAAAVA